MGVGWVGVGGVAYMLLASREPHYRPQQLSNRSASQSTITQRGPLTDILIMHKLSTENSQGQFFQSYSFKFV